MAKKRGDEQYGYDPEGAAARTLLDRLELQAEQRPDKPARKLGDVLKLPKVTPTTKRLIEAKAAIIDGQPDEKAYLHSVLCQTGLPYRPTDLRRWQRRQGAATLLIEAGSALDPRTGDFVELGLPHGERPRLILIHLSTQAVLNKSPTIDVGGSLTAFARSIGVDTNGPSIRRFKDQLARLAASTVRLGVVAAAPRRSTRRSFAVSTCGCRRMPTSASYGLRPSPSATTTSVPFSSMPSRSTRAP
jgi:hypothetical protein